MVTYQPAVYKLSNYQLEPPSWWAWQCLNVVLHTQFGVALRCALTRQPLPLGSPAGCGLEYPVRADKAGFVRLLFGKWNPKRDRAEQRKFYCPEALYLGVLAATLRTHGHHDDARQLEQFAPVDSITVHYLPNPFDPENYRLEPHEQTAFICLVTLLGLRDLTQARDYALTRTAFTGLRYHTAGVIAVTAHDGQTQRLPEAQYLDLLDQILTAHHLEPIRAPDQIRMRP
jgi:hypothetical protein